MGTTTVRGADGFLRQVTDYGDGVTVQSRANPHELIRNSDNRYRQAYLPIRNGDLQAGLSKLVEQQQAVRALPSVITPPDIPFGMMRLAWFGTMRKAAEEMGNADVWVDADDAVLETIGEFTVLRQMFPGVDLRQNPPDAASMAEQWLGCGLLDTDWVRPEAHEWAVQTLAERRSIA